MGDRRIDELQARAHAGDVDAMTVLARRMLVGDGVPAAPADAIALLKTAASRGGAAAALQLSVCAAWGAGQSRSLSEAFDYLARAAELGASPAQKELQLLARHPGGDWTELRSRIELRSLTAVPVAELVSTQPRIAIIRSFATPEECDWLIERARPGLTQALVYRDSPDARAASSRTNTEAAFTIFRADVLLNLLRERMAAAIGVSTRFFEITKALHYDPGEEFGLHADFLQTQTPEQAREVDLRGQRSTTFLTYLNDGYQGGETEFPRLGFRHKGARGDALVFWNLDANQQPDYRTVHAGLAPITGEKWLLSQWVRTKPVG